MALSKTRIATASLWTAMAFACISATDDQRNPRLGEQVDDFQLRDSDGLPRALSEWADSQAIVVVFLGTECPLVRLYASRLVELAEQYARRGVAFIGINSNQQDSITEIKHFVRTHQLNFPLLKDPGNTVADMFAASRTPEVFLLDQQRKVRYHGRIDDQYTYGLQRHQVGQQFLAQALDELLLGEHVTTPQTEVVGCHIGRVFKADLAGEVTYCNQVSRILQANCVRCHRAGEIAPFALDEYDEVVGWAEMIAEVVQQQRMPPWHANPEHGQFSNDTRLSDADKRLIYHWVKDGAPYGDSSQLPTPIEFSDGWQIGQPDVVISMRDRPFHVPARGSVEYQYFLVDPGFSEDKWVKAAECRPGNRAVVHHIIVGIRGEGEFGRREGVHDLQSEFIAATAPGAPPAVLPEGCAKLVPAGSKLVFQLHYTPNGTATEDLSQIGLVFADPEEVQQRVLTLMAFNAKFEIPPGADRYPVRARFQFPQEATLISFFPHMHLRGKSFQYVAHYPDGQQEVLLDVPHYDFNWQNGYRLAQPKTMPKGTVIRCLAHFDNSAENLANPDPGAKVRWGDQTWEEMMIGYFDVAVPRN